MLRPITRGQERLVGDVAWTLVKAVRALEQSPRLVVVTEVRARRGTASGAPRPGGTTEVQVAALDQGPHLPVRHRAVEHPEAAVGMDPADALRAQDPRRLLDTARHLLRQLHLVVLDVDDAHAQDDRGLEAAEDIQLAVPPPRELEHQVIALEGVEEG